MQGLAVRDGDFTMIRVAAIPLEELVGIGGLAMQISLDMSI